jgi:transposase
LIFAAGVVDAIEQGLSCRQAAERFGVSASRAIRRFAQLKKQGDVAAKRQGGDRKSGRIEAEADLLLGEVAKTPDATLVELQGKLKMRGVSVGVGTLWRFFDRRRITFKKRRRMPPSSNALNAKLRRAVRTRGHFPTDEAAMKLLYLVLRQVAGKWKMPPREWCEAKTQFAIMFDERFVTA